MIWIQHCYRNLQIHWKFADLTDDNETHGSLAKEQAGSDRAELALYESQRQFPQDRQSWPMQWIPSGSLGEV